MILKINTSKKDEVLDITDNVLKSIQINKGIIILNILHTTAAISTADLDPGTDKDILDALRAIIPDLKYRHPHDPSHTPDHILSTLLGTDLSLTVNNKKLILGSWQRIVLLEFDGPRQRSINLTQIPA